MTALDAKFGALALKLLAKYGKVMQYIVVDNTAPYDPVTGRVTQVSTTSTVSGFVSRTTLDGSPLEAKMREILLAGPVVNATPNDHIIVEGINYTVIANKPIYSGESIALHVITAQQK